MYIFLGKKHLKLETCYISSNKNSFRHETRVFPLSLKVNYILFISYVLLFVATSVST